MTTMTDYDVVLTGIECLTPAHDDHRDDAEAALGRIQAENTRLQDPTRWTLDERKRFLFEATKASYAEGTRAGCEELAIHAAELDTENERLRQERDAVVTAARCPSGCPCVFPEDPDMHECACDGPCSTATWDDLSGMFAPALSTGQEEG